MKMTATTNSSFWLILLVTLGLSYAVMAEDVLKESPYSIVSHVDHQSTHQNKLMGFHRIVSPHCRKKHSRGPWNWYWFYVRRTNLWLVNS